MSDQGVAEGSGRGARRFAVVGHDNSLENRVSHIEDYLGDLITAGTLPPFADVAPAEGEEEVAEELPAP
jgi:hypothetical protein